jgi:hypothetical protein
MASFLASFNSRLPHASQSQKNWTAIADPRRCAYGPLESEGWKWQVVIDMDGLPANAVEILEQCQMSADARSAIRDHQIGVFVFLVEAPPEVVPTKRMEGLCQAAWAWLDAGASALAWPEGRACWNREELASLDPVGVTSQDVDYFTTYGVVGPAPKHGQFWLRTWGMGQFELPDLVCLSSDSDDDGQAADVLLMSMKAYLLERGAPLPIGDTITLEHRAWEVCTPETSLQLDGFASRHGTQYFRRIR